MSHPRLAVLLFGAAFATAAVQIAASAQTIQVSKENRTIAITATDKVIVMADMASVHIGFIAYGPDSESAYANGSRISNAIVKALTAAGVAKDAIESESQNVSPVQEYEIGKLSPEEKMQRKFQLTQGWTVRTSADDAAKVLDLAVKAGANQSGQIDWSLRDENAPEAEAAAKALQHARTQAAQMAKSLDARLGVLLYGSNTTQSAPPRPLMRAMGMTAVSGQNAVEPLAINPRRMERSATVYAVFAIE